MGIIIKNRENMNLNRNPLLMLKFNKLLNNLGFKKAVFGGIIGEDSFERNLTLYIQTSIMNNPSFGYEKKEINLELGEQFFKLHYNYPFSELETEKIQHSEVSIKKDMREWNILFLSYLKKRNIVILNFPFDKTFNPERRKDYPFFKWICEELTKGIKELKIKKVDIKDEIKKRNIEKFLTNIRNEIERSKMKIKDIEEELENTQESLVITHKRLMLEIRKKEINKDLLKNFRRGLFKRIEEIRKLRFVKRVNLSGKGIRVDFKDKIYFKAEGEEVELGEMFMYIQPNKVLIENKKPVLIDRSKYHSCHISGDNVCFGESREKFYKYLAELRLKELVYFTYLYLKSYNKDDVYVSVEQWKKARANGGEYLSNEEEEEDREGEEYCPYCDNLMSECICD